MQCNPPSQILLKFGTIVPIYHRNYHAKFYFPTTCRSCDIAIRNLALFPPISPKSAIMDFCDLEKHLYRIVPTISRQRV